MIPPSLSAEEIKKFQNDAAEALEKLAGMLRSGEAVLRTYAPGTNTICVEYEIAPPIVAPVAPAVIPTLAPKTEPYNKAPG